MYSALVSIKQAVHLLILLNQKFGRIFQFMHLGVTLAPTLFVGIFYKHQLCLAIY